MSTDNPNADLAASIRLQRLRNTLKSPGSVIAGMGGSAYEYPENMKAGFKGYWAKTFDPAAKQEVERQGNGGYLMRVGQNQATYSREGLESFDINSKSDFNLMANIDPTLGPYWESIFPGFKAVYLS